MQPLPAVTYTPAFTVTWGGQGNEVGAWLYDVQVRAGADGTWMLWKQATPATVSVFTGAHSHSYYFRTRATDSLGNRGEWPTAPQAWTTLDLSSTLHLTVGPFFADENRNDVWDTPTTGADEIALTGVSLHFVDEAGHDVVSPTVGTTWAFTTTIVAGETYRLQMTAVTATNDYIRILLFTWPRGGEVYSEDLGVLGLWPVRRIYMPLVMRR